MVNIKKFPRGILDQVISSESGTPPNERALDPGLWIRSLAESWFISDGKSRSMAARAPGPGLKPQATKPQASSGRPQAASIKPQASKPQASASSVKPQAASSLILDPRNMDIGEVLEEQGPRVFAKINVLCG